MPPVTPSAISMRPTAYRSCVGVRSSRLACVRTSFCATVVFLCSPTSTRGVEPARSWRARAPAVTTNSNEFRQLCCDQSLTIHFTRHSGPARASSRAPLSPSMMSSDTRRPSAFDPIVFTSRFISCSRKSSLRPHGSALSASVDPVRHVRAEPRDLLADVGACSRRARFPARRRSRRPAARSRSSRTRSRSRCFDRRRVLRRPRQRPARRGGHQRPALVEIGAQMIAFARRACVSRSASASSIGRARALRPAPPAPLRRLRPAARGSSAPAAGAAGRPASARRRPGRGSRAWSSAVSSAAPNASLNSDVDAGGCRSCSESSSSTRPRATSFATSARTSLSIAASDCGIRSCRSRCRWLSARIVTPMRRAIVFARDGRKAGHAT